MRRRINDIQLCRWYVLNGRHETRQSSLPQTTLEANRAMQSSLHMLITNTFSTQAWPLTQHKTNCSTFAHWTLPAETPPTSTSYSIKPWLHNTADSQRQNSVARKLYCRSHGERFILRRWYLTHDRLTGLWNFEMLNRDLIHFSSVINYSVYTNIYK